MCMYSLCTHTWTVSINLEKIHLKLDTYLITDINACINLYFRHKCDMYVHVRTHVYSMHTYFEWYACQFILYNYGYAYTHIECPYEYRMPYRSIPYVYIIIYAYYAYQ